MISVYWAGWFKEGTSDKIWGILKVGEAYYNFWCRRGAKMQFKKTLSLKYYHKADKGYKSITSQKLEEIYPGFFDEAQSNLVFALMADKVR
jgi:hypothetical protein